MTDRWTDLLPYFVAETLPRDEQRAMEQHLAECPACRSLVAEWQEVDATVRREVAARLGELPPLRLPSADVERPSPRAVRGAWSLRSAFTGLAGAIVTILLALVLAWPGTLTAAAEGFETLVQRLILGRHTTIEQMPLVTATPTKQPTLVSPLVTERQGDYYVVRTTIGSFTSPATVSGREGDLRRFERLDALQEALPYALRQPSYLPTGYAFREALVTPLHRAFVVYGDGQGNVVLLQMPVGKQTPAEGTTDYVAVVEMLTDQTIESVELLGQPAAWVGSRTLMWESEGMNYLLGGTNLTRDEALRIAASLD